jgi:branched-chain amino acid aminotransferase
MVVANCSDGSMWGELRSEPYGAIPLEPAATILNYGQGIFEGIKAYRTERGRIVLFRPQKNGKRMADGARRMLMPPLPPSLFLQACSKAVTENADLVPPCGQGALYLRPLLFGSGADLGVKPSSQYVFCVFVSPVGQYFGPGTTGARMELCTHHQRAAPIGVGHVKCVGNYAQCFGVQRDAKANGFSDVIYLDVHGENIDEAAASNFFCVDEHRVVHTPPLGTILPGVTRDSIIQLIRRMRGQGIQLKVGKLPASVALGASEAFLTGTGAGITPIEHISSEQDSADFPCPGPVTRALQRELSDIQAERKEDSMGWLHDPFVDAAFSRDSYQDPVF